ncbi:MAG: cation transporting ATPase C-terminal domain-containing protein [Candidatus Poribacteria bacterium]|nr:cation transporting ATPase C-terminal domain-containing protein [Candidatus Poribacteria bacterium]MDE0469158.1 cation transporting ATPase C-terminal domain-containing protein [Candidatus Poribacteria bacterium]
MSNFHAENLASILNKFDSNMDQGLSAEAIEKAKAQYGKNEFGTEESAFSLEAFLKPLFTWRIIVLALMTAFLAFSFFTDVSSISLYTVGIVGAVLVVHIVWACITEYRIHSRNIYTNKLIVPNIKVIRQGKFDTCPPEDIVPGDLLSFSAGDYIPADARIIESEGLMIDESALFGTEGPVQKVSIDVPDSTIPPEKQKNMAFGGTYVTAGHGYAIVVQTGKQLEIWRQRRDIPPTSTMNTFAENETSDLQIVIKIAGITIAAVGVAIAWWFEYQNQATDWHSLIYLGMLFAIASAPQNAPGLLQLFFSKHTQKLLKKGIVLRNSRSLEKLSRITALFANEDGLSTTRDLTISNLFVDEQLVDGKTWQTWLDSLTDLSAEERQQAITAMSPNGKIPQGAPHLVFTAGLGVADGQDTDDTLSSNGQIASTTLSDDTVLPPQATIQENMRKLGYQPDSVSAKLPLVNTYPSTRNYRYQMQVFESAPENYLNIIFGDARTVLDTCGYVLINDEIAPLLDDRYEMYHDIIDYLLSPKSQVYGVAFHASDVVLKPQEMEDNPIFLGFISFSVSNDEHTKAVLKSSLDTGLKIILVSENTEQETVDLAKDLGLIHNRKAVVSSEELEEVEREQLDNETEKWLAYSQLTWDQRRNVVLSLKRQGHAVGFLGQNSKDLRAMTVADITLANRTDGSHVVQAAADGLIDKFEAVRDALLYAREAYHNAAGFLRWSFSCTLSLLLTLTFGTVLHYLYKMPMPLTLTQIVWVQLLSTLLPSLVIGTEQIFADEKHHRPTLFSGSRFLSKTTGVDIVCRAATISLMTIIPFLFILWRSPALSDTFGVSTLMQDVLSTGNAENPNTSVISIARTVACTTLIFTQLATCWQALRYPWESLAQRILANPGLIIISVIVIALHLTAIYVEPIAQFLGMGYLKWEWQWTLLFSLAVLLLPLNLAINSRPDDD